MRKIFTFLFLLVAIIFFSKSFAQTPYPIIYASIASGSWATLGTWEVFTGNLTNTPGAIGAGALATSAPSGKHYVFIRRGHKVTTSQGVLNVCSVPKPSATSNMGIWIFARDTSNSYFNLPTYTASSASNNVSTLPASSYTIDYYNDNKIISKRFLHIN